MATRRTKNVNDLNTYIPVRLINRFNKLVEDFEAFKAETGDDKVTLYEDINTFFDVETLALVNGQILVDGEVFNETGYFLDDEDGDKFFDEFEFKEDLKYFSGCLRRAKKVWSMDVEEIDTLSDAAIYGKVVEDEAGNMTIVTEEESQEEEPANVDPVTGISLDGVIMPDTQEAEATTEATEEAEEVNQPEAVTEEAAEKYERAIILSVIRSAPEEKKAPRKFKKSEAKQITDVMMDTMLSPFKVQNWINNNMCLKTKSGLTIREILAAHGFTQKKLRLTDLFQVDGHPCTLEKVCKVSDFDAVEYWVAQFAGAGIFVPTVALPHEYYKVGNYYYKAVPAENNVFAFLQSLDAVKMINEYHDKEAERIKGLLDKDKAKVNKAAAKEAKTFAKAAKKVRNEEVSRIIAQLKAVPVCATYSPYQLAKTALTMFYAA